jgi:hypothetical protein
MNLSSVSGTITGNVLDGLQYYGILLANNCGSLTLSGNEFNGITNPNPSGSPTWGSGIRTYTPSCIGAIDITGNQLLGCYNGIGIQAGSDITGMAIGVAGGRDLSADLERRGSAAGDVLRPAEHARPPLHPGAGAHEITLYRRSNNGAGPGRSGPALVIG